MMCATPLFAVGAKDKDKTEFNRHWFMQVQAGAAYTLGETGFGELLSPAAASFDKYRNFEERGNDFKAVVRAL